MTSSPSEGSPLGRLVLFLVCLAIAGSIVAGAHYNAVDRPAQNAVQVPANSVTDGSGLSRPPTPSPAAPAPMVPVPKSR